MKKILLTGGSGFIGKNILESALASKYEIVAPSHAELDVSDTESVDTFFRNRNFDCVLHSCAKPGHRNAKDTTKLLYTNLRMFENLERHKDKYGKFINFGSGAVYDQSRDISDATEDEIFKRVPADEHGFCKYAIAKQIEKLPKFTDLIIFGIFGEYEDFEIRFISNAACKAVLGMPITLRQNRRFSYIDVSDLMPVLEFFIENETRHPFYNIVGDNFVELAQVAEIVRVKSGGKVPVKIASAGFGYDYYGRNTRLKSEFAQLEFTSMEKSIERICRHYSNMAGTLDRELLNKNK